MRQNGILLQLPLKTLHGLLACRLNAACQDHEKQIGDSTCFTFSNTVHWLCLCASHNTSNETARTSWVNASSVTPDPLYSILFVTPLLSLHGEWVRCVRVCVCVLAPLLYIIKIFMFDLSGPTFDTSDWSVSSQRACVQELHNRYLLFSLDKRI